MTPEDLAQALLAAPDAGERRALLAPREGDFYVRVTALLKEEATQESRRDPNAALRIADVAQEVADVAGIPRCQTLAAWARGNALNQRSDFLLCI